MKVIESGHVYEVNNLEHPGKQTITFIKRSSGAIDYGKDEHPGTNTQEVLRALIERTEYFNSVLESVETQDAAWHLRKALFCYEARAYRRKQQKLNKKDGVNEAEERYEDLPFNEQDIETRPVGPDGHILVDGA